MPIREAPMSSCFEGSRSTRNAIRHILGYLGSHFPRTLTLHIQGLRKFGVLIFEPFTSFIKIGGNKMSQAFHVIFDGNVLLPEAPVNCSQIFPTS